MQPVAERDGRDPALPVSPVDKVGATLNSAPAAAAGRSVSRQGAVDVARGLAVLLMIQTHAFDGWVHPLHKNSLAYGLTRVVASIPAPLFLLLAGVGLSLGAQSAKQRGQAVQQTRWRLARRGLGITALGYGVSLLYAVIENIQPASWQPAQILRADILHCIGLSLSLCALLLVGRRQPRVWAFALLAGSIVAALGVPRVVPPPTHAWAAAVLGLWIDVPAYTRFPVFPLVAFCALGFCVGESLHSQPTPPRKALRGFLACLAAAGLAWLGTRGLLRAFGGSLSRQHPAVIANLFDGTMRAMAVVFLAQLVVHRLPERSAALRVLLRLGGASLFVYALHIPLCYGRLAAPLANRLSVAAAGPVVLLLMALCWALVVAREALRGALTARRARRPGPPARSAS